MLHAIFYKRLISYQAFVFFITCTQVLLASEFDDRLHLEQKFSKSFYKFNDPSLFDKVFSHPSIKPGNKNSFGTLELLGDKALGLIITDYLCRLQPNDSEGYISESLSKLVSNESNAAIARQQLGLLEYISRVDHGDGIETILADTCEALVGAIYKDKGIEAAKKFVLKNWIQKPKNVPQKHNIKNTINLLENYRLEYKIPTPHFKVIQKQPVFQIKACYEGVDFHRIFEGKTKREAKDYAAHYIVELLEKNKFSEIIAGNKSKKEIAQLFYRHILGVEGFKVASSKKEESKPNSPSLVRIKHSVKKLEELSQKLDKNMPVYTVISKPEKIGRVTVGGKYGFLEVSGSHPQQKAATEMYHKITGVKVNRKKAKEALQEICRQENLGSPQYATISQGNQDGTFEVQVAMGNFVQSAVSKKSIEDAKKLAAKKLYEQLVSQ